MKNLILPFAVLSFLFFASCGASKKLQSENDQLKSQNTELTNKVNDLQKQVSDLTASNKTITDNYNTYKTSCEDSKAKLQAVQSYISEQYSIMQELEKKIQAAEANFKDKGVDVYYKNGLVHVSMQDALLYKSGSAAVNPKGKEALGKLAAVLNDYPKLQVFVVGNTDSVQFKKGGDNWSLSTERANGVVRILRDDYKVDPSRLVSAGRGKYDPIGDNKTEAGRTQNRRTDIILNPDLKKMWDNAAAQVK